MVERSTNKRLIVLFDGTWNDATEGDAPTNVFRLATAIHGSRKTDKQQIALYLQGVGTRGSKTERLRDGATGGGLDEAILSAYMFLAQNYIPAEDDVPADEIFLFGFSRGAFSARSLCGFITASGLLKRQTLARVAEAWDYYRTPPRKRAKKVYTVDRHEKVEVKCLGVWDTVGSLGIPNGLVFLGTPNAEYQFHDTSPSPLVRNAFQALAIDEFRDEFVPTLWTGQQPPNTRIEQVWFAGAHADVGGGYLDGALANIPLHWMAERAEACGLKLDKDMLPAIDDTTPFAPRHDSRTNLWIKDIPTPTIRQVLGRPADVPFWQRLYFPMKPDKSPLPVINASIHQSVFKRLSDPALAKLSTDDAAGKSKVDAIQRQNLGNPIDPALIWKPAPDPAG
jgi:uncharacterized protein (DUF2235 family)